MLCFPFVPYSTVRRYKKKKHGRVPFFQPLRVCFFLSFFLLTTPQCACVCVGRDTPTLFSSIASHAEEKEEKKGNKTDAERRLCGNVRKP